MESEIDAYIMHLATERGLSDHYQLLTRRNLEAAAAWLHTTHSLSTPDKVLSSHLTEYLGVRKRGGLSAASLRLVLISWRGFYRFLLARGRVIADPTVDILSPRAVPHLPETMAVAAVEQLLSSLTGTQPLSAPHMPLNTSTSPPAARMLEKVASGVPMRSTPRTSSSGRPSAQTRHTTTG